MATPNKIAFQVGRDMRDTIDSMLTSSKDVYPSIAALLRKAVGMKRYFDNVALEGKEVWIVDPKTCTAQQMILEVKPPAARGAITVTL